MSATFALLLLAALLQDTETLRTELKQAILDGRHTEARDAIRKLGEMNSAAGVDEIVRAIALCGKTQCDFSLQNQEHSGRLRNLRARLRRSEDPADRKEIQNGIDELQKRLRSYEDALIRLRYVERLCVDALQQTTDPKATEEILGRFKHAPEWFVRRTVALAFGGTNKGNLGAECDALLEQLQKETEADVKVAILDAIRALKDKRPQTVSTVVAQLKSPHWQVALAALLYLRDMRRPESVEGIIAALASADGRLKFEIVDTLAQLTGVAGISDAAGWKAWWEENGKKFLAGEYEPRLANGRDPGSGTRYFGVPVRSKNVLFIVDVSTSMDEEAAFVLGDEDASLPRQLRPQGNHKLDIAKSQLKKVLSQLPIGTRFNIIASATEARLLAPEPIELTEASRKRSFELIDRLQAGGATNLFDPLEMALGLAVDAEGKLKKDGPDSVYLLSDGLATMGRVTQPDKILERVVELNVLRKVAIHSIWIAAKDDKGVEFMKDLARQSGGICIVTKPKK